VGGEGAVGGCRSLIVEGLRVWVLGLWRFGGLWVWEVWEVWGFTLGGCVGAFAKSGSGGFRVRGMERW